MYDRKPRKFRYSSNVRRHRPRNDVGASRGLQQNSFNNGRGRNNFKPYQSAEKLVEKYMNLAKEALSTGDRTLSENYYQHADHYMRVVDEKKISQNKVQSIHEENKSNNSSSTKEPSPKEEQIIQEEKKI
jgi:hypothetical protein